MVGNKSVGELLDDMNAAKYREYIPVVVFLVLMFVIGLVGNTFACVFYWRDTRQTAAKRLILALVAIDTVVCLMMVISFLFLRLVYLLDNGAFCKTAYFIQHVTVLAAAFGVLSIVVFRYRAICKSHGTRLTLTHGNITIGSYCLFSVVESVPMLLIVDTVSINVTVSHNVTVPGHDCGLVIHDGTRFLNMVVDIIDVTLFVGGLLVLCVLYICIAKTVWINKKRLASFNTGRPVPRTKTRDIVDETSNGTDCSSDTETRSMRSRRMADVADANTDGGHAATYPTRGTNAKQTDVIPKSPCSPTRSSNNYHNFQIKRGTLESWKSDSRRNLVGSRSTYTMMTFVITIVFVVSFLPYFCITILSSVTEDYIDDEGTLVKFAKRSFLLNSVINPIIYGYYNSRFRDLVWTIFKKLNIFRKIFSFN